MKLSIKILFLVSLFPIAACKRESTPPPLEVPVPDNIRVTARIVDSGLFDDGGGPRESFVVQADVRNLSSVPVGIYIMTCSWGDSWTIGPQEAFEVPIWGCDSNYPHCVTFKAGGGWTFRFLVRSKSGEGIAAGKTFRVGFLCAGSYRGYLEQKSDIPKVFSEWLSVPPIADRVVALPNPYQEPKELPNQRREGTPGESSPSNPSQVPGPPDP